MRKRLEAYTMATELKFVARPQSEKRTNESETDRKQPIQRELNGPASTSPLGMATEPRCSASVQQS